MASGPRPVYYMAVRRYLQLIGGRDLISWNRGPIQPRMVNDHKWSLQSLEDLSPEWSI